MGAGHRHRTPDSRIKDREALVKLLREARNYEVAAQQLIDAHAVRFTPPQTPILDAILSIVVVGVLITVIVVVGAHLAGLL